MELWICIFVYLYLIKWYKCHRMLLQKILSNYHRKYMYQLLMPPYNFSRASQYLVLGWFFAGSLEMKQSYKTCTLSMSIISMCWGYCFSFSGNEQGYSPIYWELNKKRKEIFCYYHWKPLFTHPTINSIILTWKCTKWATNVEKNREGNMLIICSPNVMLCKHYVKLHVYLYTHIYKHTLYTYIYIIFHHNINPNPFKVASWTSAHRNHF